MPRNNDLWILIGLALLSLVLARLPLLNLLVYPFELFNTFIHEMSHIVATLLTGGRVERFEIYRDGSGVALVRGGVTWIIASAGYLGSALVGGALLLLTARGVAPRTVLLALGVFMAIMSLLFVRNIFGILAGLLLVAALIGAATKLEPRWSGALLLFLTVQMCLKSLDSLWDLLRISTSLRGRTTTDAQIMQQLTGVPGIVWALLWSAVALLILWQSVRIAYFKG
jgi:hypothetical protein